VADPSPFVASQVADDAGVYRPISGFAVSGLALSGLYTVLVLLSALKQFFLPGYMILLPIGGVALSLLAVWQIRAAEGTRAGMKLARWGVLLGLLSGGSYALYDAVTTFAIKVQANRFLMEEEEDSGFFPLLQKGETGINAAFLLTQTYARRFGGKPHDEEAMRIQFDTPMSPSPTGFLTQFRNTNLVRIFHQAFLEHGAVTVEPAGIRAVQYSALGPKVARAYQISTPEVNFEVVLVVQSTENDSSGEGRKWFVVWTESSMSPTIKRTPVGLRMLELRMSTRDAVDKWIEYDNRAAKKVPQNVEGAKIAAADRAEVIEDFKRKLATTPANRLTRLLKFSDPNFAFWDMPDKSTLRIAHSFQILLLGDDGREGYHYMGFGRFVVEAPVSGDPRTSAFTPQWKLKEIILERALPVPRGK
jgi:hypothetical protein